MDSVSMFTFFSYANCDHRQIFSTKKLCVTMAEKRRAEIKVPFGSDVNLACMNNFRSETNNQEKRKKARYVPCPLTPNEVGLLLGALGHRSNVHIYAACVSSPKSIYGTFHGNHATKRRILLKMTPAVAKNSEDDPTRTEEVIDIGAGDDSFAR
ncbi:hypothetical protein VPH35_081252 [Triticum aestivum]